ncbi:hypothetical protein ES705_09326 [subsurface metagenome]
MWLLSIGGYISGCNRASGIPPYTIEMIAQRRDSKGHFIKGNTPWNKRWDSPQREMISLFVPGVIGGGVLKLERIQAICPACGQQVEAVAGDGRVRGYCAVARQYVDFLAEKRGKKKFQS